MQFKVIKLRLETRWSNYEQAEFKAATLIEGPNPCVWKNTGMTCG